MEKENIQITNSWINPLAIFNLAEIGEIAKAAGLSSKYLIKLKYTFPKDRLSPTTANAIVEAVRQVRPDIPLTRDEFLYPEEFGYVEQEDETP